MAVETVALKNAALIRLAGQDKGRVWQHEDGLWIAEDMTQACLGCYQDKHTAIVIVAHNR